MVFKWKVRVKVKVPTLRPELFIKSDERGLWKTTVRLMIRSEKQKIKIKMTMSKWKLKSAERYMLPMLCDGKRGRKSASNGVQL